jgi:predicted flap endonuclease-1-like 5' DNA nuclease
MDLQKILQELFTFENQEQALVFALLLVATFFLGVLVWTLLFHFPKNRRLRRENEKLKTQVQGLEETVQDLGLRNQNQDQKIKQFEQELQQTREELQEKKMRLYEAESQADTLAKTMQQHQHQAEMAQAEAEHLKEAYRYLQIAEKEAKAQMQQAIEQAKEAVSKAEELKAIVEEVEQEKSILSTQTQEAQQTAQQLQSQFQEIIFGNNQLRSDLERASQELDQLEAQNTTLQQQLEQTHQQLSEEQQMRLDLEHKLNLATDELYQLQHHKSQVEKQLSAYTEKEVAQQQEEQSLQTFFEDQAALAQENLEQGLLYQGAPEGELVEDAEHLEKQLQAHQNPTPSNQSPFEAELEWEAGEWDLMEQNSELAKQALMHSGLFNDIESSILLERENEYEGLSDEDYFNRVAEEAKDNVLGSTLFQDLSSEALIEDETLLDEQLQAETPPLVQSELPADLAIPEEEPALSSEVSAAEQDLMQRALELSTNAFNREGLYSSHIETEKLIDVETDPLVAQTLTIDPKYKTDIEKAVVTELGRTIPRASEAEKDDLKQIQGVGLFIEQRLNHLGIFTFEQITHFQPSFIPKITAAIGFAEDTIQRDRWIEQAKELLTKRKIQLLTKDLPRNVLPK